MPPHTIGTPDSPSKPLACICAASQVQNGPALMMLVAVRADVACSSGHTRNWTGRCLSKSLAARKLHSLDDAPSKQLWGRVFCLPLVSSFSVVVSGAHALCCHPWPVNVHTVQSRPFKIHRDLMTRLAPRASLLNSMQFRNARGSRFRNATAHNDSCND